MSLVDDLKAEVKKILISSWNPREGTVVPEPGAIKLGNDGVYLDATVLYADSDGSTKMVDTQTASFAAEMYKCYRYCAGRVITSENGAITAYDGDRVMAVFIGDWKNTEAVRAAMKINYVRNQIINPAIKSHYATKTFTVSHGIGIDTSKLLVARTGVRGANDLVWVGRAANYAAKLSDLGDNNTWITKAVFDRIHSSAKVTNGQDMWELRIWTAMNGISIYRSGWQWRVP